MSRSLTFILTGKPLVNKSPVFTTRSRGGKTFAINPLREKLRERRIEILQSLPVGFQMWELAQPIGINIIVRLQKLKTKPTDPVNLHPPDLDNIAKCYLDILKGIVFEDDCQVTSLSLTKKISINNEVEITCSPLEGEDL